MKKYYDVTMILDKELETQKAYGFENLDVITGKRYFKCDDGVVRSELMYKRIYIPKSQTVTEEGKIYASKWILCTKKLFDLISGEYIER